MLVCVCVWPWVFWLWMFLRGTQRCFCGWRNSWLVCGCWMKLFDGTQKTLTGQRRTHRNNTWNTFTTYRQRHRWRRMRRSVRKTRCANKWETVSAFSADSNPERLTALPDRKNSINFLSLKNTSKIFLTSKKLVFLTHDDWCKLMFFFMTFRQCRENAAGILSRGGNHAPEMCSYLGEGWWRTPTVTCRILTCMDKGAGGLKSTSCLFQHQTQGAAESLRFVSEETFILSSFCQISQDLCIQLHVAWLEGSKPSPSPNKTQTPAVWGEPGTTACICLLNSFIICQSTT